MTPEAQRTAIAEACGWDFDPVKARGFSSRGKWAKPPTGHDLVFRHNIPDYLADLNAMHEAEKATDMHRNQQWAETIVETALHEAVMLFHKTDGWDWVLLISRLSAAQRAEAFLRTIGKWVES